MTSGNRFAVQRNDEPLLETEDCVGSYAYWDKQRIQRNTLMNAQTGEIDNTTVSELGSQPLPRLQQDAPALQIETEFTNIKLWYSTQANGLRSKPKQTVNPLSI